MMNEPMTAKQRILAKPTLAQRIIKARMTKLAIDDPNPDWEAYGAQALDWWDDFMKERPPDVSETKFAELAIERLKDHPLWGTLLP